MASNTSIVEIEESTLGTIEHWNLAYKRELGNFDDQADIGEIWFGEEVQARVCDWIAIGCEIQENDEGEVLLQSNNFPGITCRSKILDIGCGNAAALVYLVEEYSFSNLVGMDYSEPGVELARKVVGRDEATKAAVQIAKLDITDLDHLHNLHKSGSPLKFDLLFDKGTYDAICLNKDKQMRAKYVAAVCSMMNSSNSYFVITSCNWTKDEIISTFTSSSTYESRKQHHAELAGMQDHSTCSLQWFATYKHPEFSYGGSSGSTVATVAFQLVSSHLSQPNGPGLL